MEQDSNPEQPEPLERILSLMEANQKALLERHLLADKKHEEAMRWIIFLMRDLRRIEERFGVQGKMPDSSFGFEESSHDESLSEMWLRERAFWSELLREKAHFDRWFRCQSFGSGAEG